MIRKLGNAGNGSPYHGKDGRPLMAHHHDRKFQEGMISCADGKGFYQPKDEGAMGRVAVKKDIIPSYAIQ